MDLLAGAWGAVSWCASAACGMLSVPVPVAGASCVPRGPGPMPL
jgi:hypothetical protein